MITCRRMLGGKRVSILLCTLVAAFGIARAQQAPGGPQDACAQILAACEKAGFVLGGAGSGNGLGVDCIRPILQGNAERRKTSKPLPQIDPQVIAACNAAGGVAALAQMTLTGTPPPQPAPIPPEHPPAQGSPNIVFILTDDLANNLVQFMPHVLAMQKSGVTFTNYFVTDSLCCPSRSSIFTGRYPHDTGVFTNQGEDGGYGAFTARGNDQSSFAVALARAGYRTAFLGKYLNGYQPNQHPGGPGWHHWVVAGNGYPEFNYTFNQDGTLVAHGSKPDDYLTDVVAADGVRFIKENAKAPFFIEIATFAPHLPYTPAPRDAEAFPGLRAPRGPAYNVTPTPAPRWLASHPALTQEAMDAIDRDFRKRAQSVLAVDRMIGDLQAAVAEIGQQKNTYFIFSSDNGYHMGEYRLMPGKQTAYDTDINVPLVVTGPKIAGGRKAEEIVENIDLAPTFIQLAGGEQFPNVDGTSLGPLLHGQRVQGWRTTALVEHHGPGRDPADPDLPAPRSGNPPTYEAIRSRTALYVEYANGEREYHDLTSDPDELHNTFDSLPGDRKATLHKMLTDAANCHGAKECWVAQGGTTTALVRRRQRSGDRRSFPHGPGRFDVRRRVRTVSSWHSDAERWSPDNLRGKEATSRALTRYEASARFRFSIASSISAGLL